MKVFISYSHDSDEHRQRVLELANQLRHDGIDASIDRYVPAPDEGWQRWTQKSIEQADFVLVVCTTEYCARFEGRQEGSGHGANFEGLFISQIIYGASTKNDKFIALLPANEPELSIPGVLRPYRFYRYPAEYEELYGRLTGQPEIIPPPLGRVRPRRVSPLVQDMPRTGFRVLVIDDEANWRRNVRLAVEKLGEETEIDLADSYPEALHLLSTRRYDLAVVDLALRGKPANASEADELGLLLLAEVRGGPLNRDCAVIVLTGYATKDRSDRAFREFTAFKFLRKPRFDDRSFPAICRSAIRAARLERASRTNRSSRLVVSFDESRVLSLTLHRALQQGNIVPGWPELMERALRLAVPGSGGDVGRWQEEVLDLGSFLFRALLGGQQILSGLSSAELADLELRFSGPPSALSLPFELLRSPGDLLGLRHAITRHLATSDGTMAFSETFAQLVVRLQRAQESLRILLAADGSPTSAKEIEQIAGWTSEDLDRLGLLHEICSLPAGKVTPLAIERAVREVRPHILHYAGHGDPGGGALLPRQGGLDTSGRPYFIFLSSPGPEDPRDLRQTFEALAQSGVASVLGQRWPMSPAAARTFALTFYRALWQTFSLSRALLEARLACGPGEVVVNDLDWASPVLLSQT